MNIILYSVREDEIELLKEWEKNNSKHRLNYVYSDLNSKNMGEIAGNEIVILSQISKLTQDVYEYIKENKVKVIGTRSTGYDIFNLEFLKENNIQLINVPSYSPNAIGEYALTSALYLLRKIEEIKENVNNLDLRWQIPILSREMRTLKVGVVGTGKIGMAAAKLFKGVGAKVLGYDLYPNSKNEEILEYKDLDSLLRESDIITLHAPATKENFHLIDKDAFNKMKSSAIFINAARGSLVDTRALLEALDEKKIAAAAIDCYENEEKYIKMKHNNIEEIDDDILKELIRREDILYTPHIAFYTETALRELTTNAIDYAIEFIEKGDSLGKVKF